MAKQPSMINLDAYTQLGIDPRTGLPSKLVEGVGYPSIEEALKAMDISECCALFKWYNLPEGLDGELVERILYYRGQGAMFYSQPNQKFYFLPFGAANGVDVYGRYNGIVPLTFGGEQEDDVWIKGLVKQPQWTELFEYPTIEDALNKAVVCRNKAIQLGQQPKSEAAIVQPVIQMMAEAYPMARTNLFASSGVIGVRVNNQDESSEIQQANNIIPSAAMNGRYMIPIQAGLDLQELGGSSSANPEAYLLYMQSLDNFRQHIHGLGDGAIFEKSAHMLQSEVGMNASNVGLVLNDKLRQRKQFCLICNQLWQLGMDVEIDETVVGRDMDMNGNDADSGYEPMDVVNHSQPQQEVTQDEQQ